MSAVSRQWRTIDSAKNPQGFISFLDTVTDLDLVKSYKRLTFELMEIKERDAVLDVGCGTGADTVAIAELTSGAASITGIDISNIMIAQARERAAFLQLPIKYMVADAQKLPFASEMFDCCRADRVFQHLDEPDSALKELIRVSRLGGTIVISDPDWETLVIDGDEAILTLIKNSIRKSITNAGMARRLPAMLKAAYLSDIKTAPTTLIVRDFTKADEIFSIRQALFRSVEQGMLDEAVASAWIRDMLKRSRMDLFFSAITGFAASGRKL